MAAEKGRNSFGQHGGGRESMANKVIGDGGSFFANDSPTPNASPTPNDSPPRTTYLIRRLPALTFASYPVG